MVNLILIAVVIYVAVTAFCFVSAVVCSRIKHGKNQPEDGFTFMVLALVWPYWLWMLTGERLWYKFTRRNR